MLLLLREHAAEEVKLTFSKAGASIRGFSFLFGDQFNFMVATNATIELYKLKNNKNKAKVVKSIQVSMSSDSSFLYEPMANVVLFCDNKGICSPIFLNLYKSK